MMKVSAIVSTYNSERFFQGCIEDLMQQTLWKSGELEIVVINAGSKQGESYYIREYLRQGIPLTVITSLREPLYSSWNRGIRIAKGQYITSANTDDRHKPDAYEVLAKTLDDNPSIGLVYADAHVTPTPNATWGGIYELSEEAPYEDGMLGWPEFDPLLLTKLCYMGQAPMWRASLHQQVGYFDESYMIAGDYEMWLRMVSCRKVRMQHVPELLGIFYWHPSQLGRSQSKQSAMESRRAILKHRQRIHDIWQP